MLADCRSWCLIGGKERRWLVSHSGSLSLCFSEWLVSSLFVQQIVSRATGRPSSCSFEASTPHEAPTPVLTTKTLVPTTAIRRSTRTEATCRAPTFKIVEKKVDCAALEAPYQHREATSHTSSQFGAPGSPLLRFNAVTLGRTVGLQDCSGETCALNEDQQLRRQQVVPSATRLEHSRESLPHSCRPCKHRGFPLSWLIRDRPMKILKYILDCWIPELQKHAQHHHTR